MSRPSVKLTAPVYVLLDTFNKQLISRHRSLSAAGRASQTFAARVARKNGSGSYIPTSIRRENLERASCDSVYETATSLTDSEIAELEAVQS